MSSDIEFEKDEDYEQFKRDCTKQMIKIKDELCKWSLCEISSDKLIQEIAKIILLDKYTLDVLEKAGVNFSAPPWDGINPLEEALKEK